MIWKCRRAQVSFHYPVDNLKVHVSDAVAGSISLLAIRVEVLWGRNQLLRGTKKGSYGWHNKIANPGKNTRWEDKSSPNSKRYCAVVAANQSQNTVYQPKVKFGAFVVQIWTNFPPGNCPWKTKTTIYRIVWKGEGKTEEIERNKD